MHAFHICIYPEWLCTISLLHARLRSLYLINWRFIRSSRVHHKCHKLQVPPLATLLSSPKKEIYLSVPWLNLVLQASTSTPLYNDSTATLPWFYCFLHDGTEFYPTLPWLYSFYMMVQKFMPTQPCMALQWNLQKQTPPIMETSTMWTRVRGPKLYSIILQLL